MQAEMRETGTRRSLNRRLRKPAVVGGVGLAVLATVCANMVPANGAAIERTATDKAAQSDVAVNQSLDALAKLVARAVADDVNLRKQIRDGAAKRFDGDTNVLYKTLSSTSNVRRSLATAQSSRSRSSLSDGLATVDRLVDAVPRLQLAVPANFEGWDPVKVVPLVAYMPDGVEDTELKTVTAYDANGSAHQLDAQVAPDQPVIVLGKNERTDNSGKVLPRQDSSQFTPSSTAATTTTATAAALATKYEVRMVEVTLFDDKEPWTRGDAEISLKARSVASSSTCGTDYYDPNWANLNNSGDSWAPYSGPRHLGHTCADVAFAWWEDDGSDSNYDLYVGDFKMGVSMSNEDDMLGRQRVGHGTFRGATMQNVRWEEAISQWTD